MELNREISLIGGEIKKESIIEKIFIVLATILIIIFPFSLLLCFRVVKQYKRAVIFRFGRIRRDSPAGPGIVWLVPCTDNIVLIDLRTQAINLPPKEILTKDSVTVTVDAVVYFHVQKPLYSFMNVQNHRIATEMLAFATLRNVLGQHTLAELLTARDTIGTSIRKAIDEGAVHWGVEVERVAIKEVILPYELQRAMAVEAEGTRIARAKIIEAEGEIKAAENLREASRIMMETPKVMLLRYLQTLNFIAASQKTSILFPIPMELPDIHNWQGESQSRTHKPATGDKGTMTTIDENSTQENIANT